MNRKAPINELTFQHFLLLLRYAQEIHNEHGEPIPDLRNDSKDKIVSCLRTPFQTWSGNQLYKTFNKKAAALFYFLIKNHCLQNGNKRLAILSLSYFMNLNGRELIMPDNLLYYMAKNTALRQNKDKTLLKLNEMFRKYVRKQKLQIIYVSPLFLKRRQNKSRKVKSFWGRAKFLSYPNIQFYVPLKLEDQSN